MAATALYYTSFLSVRRATSTKETDFESHTSTSMIPMVVEANSIDIEFQCIL